jgi:hypothetical protein
VSLAPSRLADDHLSRLLLVCLSIIPFCVFTWYCRVLQFDRYFVAGSLGYLGTVDLLSLRDPAWLQSQVTAGTGVLVDNSFLFVAVNCIGLLVARLLVRISRGARLYEVRSDEKKEKQTNTGERHGEVAS